jgi:hypothetical protein
MKTYTISCDSRRGFTIIEILVTMGLFVLMIAALVLLYQGYGTLFVSEQTSFWMKTSANIAVTEIEHATLQANRILASYTISGTTYTTGPSTLVLELPSTDASGGVISGAFDHVVFYVSGTVLYRLIEANPASQRQNGTKRLCDSLSTLVTPLKHLR